ncbi:GntR family transcriptional regulator [Aquibacillus koreensis]|uniref:GntR family transcriptional regulator n=1 Tax=Aquibacillus koreensis TaxID=279446 RepID=UPI003898FC39
MSTTNTRINGSTRDFVYYTLKDQIINLELEPGTKISEKEVSEKLKVSRTPVREAFLKLAQEDLLGVFPQSGTIVTQIDLSLVEEGRFIRENIEKAIVREACEALDDDQLFQLETNIRLQELCLEKESHHKLFELDDEFHKILFEGCNKIRTWNMIRQMNSHFDRLRMLRLVADHNWSVLVAQHKEIFHFISDKKRDEAEASMALHLKLVDLEKGKLKEQYPGFFNE